MSIFKKLFGGEERQTAKYKEIVLEINKLEPKFEGFSNDELKDKTTEFKKRIKNGDTLDSILPEAFATVREAAKRTIGQRHFDVQMIGGMVLHDGKISQMATGEGKTLSSTPAIYLNALSEEGVHVVTVNDYLAKRDTNWMGPIFHLLGLSVASIAHEAAYIFSPQESPDKNEVTVEMANLKIVTRREAYEADITYGTNNEFGFDYLRDNMVMEFSQMSQRGHSYAIIDEVDSILIDEARTPLIISAPDEDSGKMYDQFARIVPSLKADKDFNIDEKMRAITLTEEGISEVEKILGIENLYQEGGIRTVHHLEQALRAQFMFKLDKDYVVKNGEILIVDEFTGRLMPGRRYSEGLHQALEAKEGVRVQKESRTLATITFQNYFRKYKKLSGMTGTALTSAEEFHKVYGLEVVPVPTNKNLIRKDMTDAIFKSEKGKLTAVARQIKECVER
ncbi:MAG: preprotein translocase subunit SecA, partial [Candidatus Portnoybacteria bacterium CG10_big_fil_rev_8_21_14_0_10_36_7]